MEDKVSLYNKYKKDSLEWEIPRDLISRDFALEIIIESLLMSHKQKHNFNANN
jgi:hypothetical protein